MKRRTSLIALLAIAILVPAPSQARTIKHGSLTFEASPCLLACSYNLAEADGTAGMRFAACEAPSPSGSYDDIVLKAPSGSKTLTITVTPAVEWDFFLCSKPSRGNNGKLIAENINNFYECQMTCPETVHVKVSAGKSYVLRAYNAWDPAALPGKYWFKS